MTEDHFWHIIEHRLEWRILAPNLSTFLPKDRTNDEDIFIQNLATYSEDEILSFANYWYHHVFRPPELDLWAAAYLIEQGCSDDCFMGWVRPGAVLLGRERFENLVKDVESLAGLPNGGQELFVGEFGSVVSSAYEMKTGRKLPDDIPNLPRAADPPGRIHYGDSRELSELLPKLWARWKHEWGSERPRF